MQELIGSSVIIKEGFKLTFESSIIERNLEGDLFDKFVSTGVAGSFYRKEKGTALEEIRADFDVNDEDEALAYVEKIIAYLERDMRTEQQTPTGVASQLRKNVDVEALYDFLWGLGYLEPEYSLKLDGKDLSHLSPGERGTLLLVFYLLVDKSNKPIIVDQPEENLDSQTVYLLRDHGRRQSLRRRRAIDGVEHGDARVPELHVAASRARLVKPRRLLDWIDYALPVVVQRQGRRRERESFGKIDRIAGIYTNEHVGTLHGKETGRRAAARRCGQAC